MLRLGADILAVSGSSSRRGRDMSRLDDSRCPAHAAMHDAIGM